MHTAVKAPFLTFVRNHAELPLQAVEEGRNSHLPKKATLPAVTYDQVLLRYQTFVDASIEDYQQLYRQYARQGGQRSFSDHSWNLLLNETVAEAATLLNEHGQELEQNEKLWQDLKRISEGCLLVLDKAMA